MNVIAFAASDRGQRRESNEDQYLIDQSLGLYIVCDVLEGRLRVDDDPVLSGELVPGDWVGEGSLLHPARVSGTIVAEQSSRPLLVSREEFTKLTRRLPRLGNLLLRNLGQRLSEQLDEIRSPDDDNLTDTILELE